MLIGLQRLPDMVEQLAFIPHGHCYLWQSGLVWLHILSDGLLAADYLAISLGFAYLARHRRDLPYPWLFHLFGTFIVACGITHAMAIWTLWFPTYWVSGLLKAITAVVSVVAVIAFFPVIPLALTLPSRRELAAMTLELEQQVRDRTQSLRQSQERYKALLESINGIVWELDIPTFRVTFISQKAAQILGYPVERWHTQSNFWLSCFHPDDRDQVLETYRRMVETGDAQDLEYRMITADGRVVWLWEQNKVLLEGDRPVKLQGILMDISDRKATEHALKIQRDFNQLIAEIASRFVNLRPHEFDAEIEQTLQLIGELTHLDTSYLLMFNPDGTTMNMTHEWCKTGLPRQQAIAQNIPLSAFPWVMERVKQRQIVYVPDVAAMTDVAPVDQVGWQRFNLAAVLSVPLVKRTGVVGLIGFASFMEPMFWEAETIRLLIVLAQTIANAQQQGQDEHQLAISEERLRLALAAANQGMYDLDVVTGEAIVSPEYVLMLGYDPATFHETNAKWIERLHPDDRTAVTATYQAYIAGTLPDYQVECRQRTASGDYKWILSMGKVVEWNETGHPVRMLGTHTDIRDRKRTETQLCDLTDRLQLALQAAKMGVWDWEIASDHINWDERLYELYGLSPTLGNPSYQTWIDIIHPEDVFQVNQITQAVLVSGNEGVLEFRVPLPNGSDRHIASYFLVQRAPDGQPLRLTGVNMDISDRKRAEASRLQAEKLRLELNLLEEILNSVLAGYWDRDFVRQTNYWSRGLKQMLGYTEHELSNAPEIWQQLIFPEDLPKVLECFQQHVQSHGAIPYYTEVRYRHKDGSTIWVICAGQVIHWDEAGEALRMVGCHVDITKLKQIEAQLRQTSAQLETSNRELEAFAYSVSHDLRAPLRAIDGFSKALLEDYPEQFDDEAQYYFDRIRYNVQRMGSLIDDLLNLSRVSRYEMQLKPVNLSQLVQEQLAELQQSDRDRIVETIIAPDVRVLADSTLIGVVINNLLANAWKFTSHHASAQIEFGIIKQYEENVYFVRDDGSGFDMTYAAKLFGVFQRLHNTDEFPGTGIGLATVQRAIHRHGGRVWAESVVERGTTIFFTIPNPTMSNRV